MANTDTVGYRRRERRVPPGTWTRERVLAAIRDWEEEFGQAPIAYEWSVAAARAVGADSIRVRRWAAEYPRWPSPTAVIDRFGSWSAALRAAGLRDEQIAPWELSLPERVEAARRLISEGIAAAEVARMLDVGPETVRRYLRAGICPDCGGPVVSPRARRCPGCAAKVAHQPGWTREAIVDALRSWARDQGGPPSAEDWVPTDDRARRWGREYPRWPSAGQVLSVFGGWSAGLEAAGLTPRPGPPTWTQEAILAAFRSFTDVHGRLPGPHELGGGELPTGGTITSHFGSMGALREALGLPRSPGAWGDERIVAAIQAFEDLHGRPPKVADWRQAGEDHPTPGTVARRFGSWGAALEAAGFSARRHSWDRGRVMDALDAHLAEHGELPSPGDWRERDPTGKRPAYHNVQQLFGTWDAALGAAGHETEHWDRGAIVIALRELGKSLGRRPVQSDVRPKRPGLPSFERIASELGSWTAALEAAGFQPRAREWAREDVLDALRRWADAHNAAPRYDDWKRAGDEHPSAGAVERLFGTWTAGVLAAGLPIAKRNWDRDAIIAALREWAAANGRTPKVADWGSADPAGRRPAHLRVQREFGSWGAALRAAGFDARPRNWTREDALEALRAWATRHGRPPTADEWAHASRDRPTVGPMQRLFGSWTAALLEAGLPIGRRDRWTAVEVLEAIREWTTEHDRPPQRVDWSRSDPYGRHPGAGTVHRHFGSWETAVRSARAAAPSRAGDG